MIKNEIGCTTVPHNVTFEFVPCRICAMEQRSPECIDFRRQTNARMVYERLSSEEGGR